MRFVETPIFTKIITGLLDDDDYRRLQIALMLRPEQGPVIRATGGLRKVRWAKAGAGKRGGLAGHLLLGSQGAGLLPVVRVLEERPGRPHAIAGAAAWADRQGGVQVKAAAFQELVASVRQAGRI